MPSSRALVVTTPMTSRLRRPLSICRRRFGRYPPPVSRDELRVHGLSLGKLVFEVFGQDLDVETACSEDDGLDVVADEFGGQPPGRRHGRLADTQFAVHDGRVVQEEGLGRRGRAAFVNERHGPFEEPFGVLPRIGDGRRTADEDRVLPVETADPDQAADDVGQVGAEDAPVDVELVDDDVLEVAEEFLPLRMVGKDPCVKHVRIRHDDVALLADGLAGVVGACRRRR